MRIRRPSHETINEARRLGVKMAAMERALRPDTAGAHQYLSYPQFVQAHRHFIEISQPFEKWDYLLGQLAEHEERSQRTWANEPSDWDSYLREIVEPIRAAFWNSWETAVGLQRQFDQRQGRKSAARAEPETHSAGSGLMELGSGAELEVRPSDLHM